MKLRAWHRELKKMFQVDAIDFSGNTIRKGEPCFVSDVENGGCFLLKNCDLLRYIERKDNNGSEIYEGDICEFDNCIGYVKYGKFTSSHEGGCSMCHYHYGFYIVDKNDNQLFDSCYEDLDWDFCKVIGNKYMNPNLL